MRKPLRNSKPDVVLYMNDPSADELVVKQLSRSFERFYCFIERAEIATHLKEAHAKVILVSGGSVSQCLTVFYEALSTVPASQCCRYKLVILIPKQCEEEAYITFTNGVIDDYLVSQPLYERYRPVTVCHYLLNELTASEKLQRNINWESEAVGSFSRELQSLLYSQSEKIDIQEVNAERSIDDMCSPKDSAPPHIWEYLSREVKPQLKKIKDESYNSTKDVMQTFKQLVLDYMTKAGDVSSNER